MSETRVILGKRGGCKLSQEQLLELVGVDFRYISKIELGKCYPSFETLEKIAQLLQVEMCELFEFSHFSAAIVTKQEIDKLLDGADEHERQLILCVTKALARAVNTNV